MSNPQKRRERHHGDLGIPAIPGTQGPAESWDRERGALRGQSDISKEANPYVLSHNLPPRGYAENPPEHTKHLRVDHVAWTKRRELEKARAERDSDGDGARMR